MEEEYNMKEDEISSNFNGYKFNDGNVDTDNGDVVDDGTSNSNGGADDPGFDAEDECDVNKEGNEPNDDE